MQHIPKQSHYVRCPAVELLCNGICGPLATKLGDPALDTEACIDSTNTEGFSNVLKDADSRHVTRSSLSLVSLILVPSL